MRRVVEAVALYPNRDDLFRNYPELEPKDLQQALAYAAANLEDGLRKQPQLERPQLSKAIGAR